MNTHADKAQENKNQSISNEGTEKTSRNASVFQFVDNRPEAIAQKKLLEIPNNSTQAKQMRAFKKMVENNTSSRTGQHESKSTNVVQRVSKIQMPLLEALLYERILTFLTEQHPDAPAGEREQSAVMSRTQTIHWLREKGNLGELDLNAAVGEGFAHFRDHMFQANAEGANDPADAQAAQWMGENTKLSPQHYQLVESALSLGNCHGLTFNHEDDLFNPDALTLIDNWHLIHDAPIAVFFQGNTLMHSTRLVHASYLHTLPNGPKFNCDPQTMLANSDYTSMFKLPEQLNELELFLQPIIDDRAVMDHIDQVEKILGYGSDKKIENAPTLYRQWSAISDENEQENKERKVGFIGRHQAQIDGIKATLTEMGVTI